MTKKQTIELTVEYRHLPPRFKKMTDEQRKIGIEYSSKTKLNAVMRWRVRMAVLGIKSGELAKEFGKPTSRISEWLNFRKEPNEDDFLKIESILYKMEQKMKKANATASAKL